MQSRKRQVLIFLPFLTRGGAETQGFLLAKGLKQKGYDVDVCGFELASKSYTLTDELEAEKLTHFVLPFQMSAFGSRVSQIATCCKFIQIIRKKKYDAIIPFTWFPNFLSALTYRFAGVEVCFWNQRNVEDHVAVFGLEKFLPIKKLKFVSNSSPGKKFLQRRFNLNSEVVAIIKNGILVRAHQKTTEQWKSELQLGSRIVITMSANFFHEKDFDTVLRAMALLKKTSPSTILLLVGGGGNPAHKNATKALAFDLNLSEHVKFLDTISDISGLLSASHIGLLSSTSEGCPNSVLEYMHAKLPVVATNIEGVADVLGKDYPYLFETGNAQMLADKLSELLEDGTLRKNIGQKLFDKVVSEYNVEQMVNSFIQLIKQ